MTSTSLLDSARAAPLWLRRTLTTPFARPNPRPVIILGNHKAGTSAVTGLLAELTGATACIDLRNELKANRYPQLQARAITLDEFIYLNRLDFSRDIVKENHLTTFYPGLRARYPTSPCALVVRDPRSNIRSILNRLRLPGDQGELTPAQVRSMDPVWRIVLDNRWLALEGEGYIESLAHRWNATTDVFLENPGEVTLQRYEDFVKDKVGQLARLARELGLTPRRDISARLDVQFQPRGDRAITWTEFFGAANLTAIERICGERMTQIGYDLTRAG